MMDILFWIAGIFLGIIFGVALLVFLIKGFFSIVCWLFSFFYDSIGCLFYIIIFLVIILVIFS